MNRAVFICLCILLSGLCIVCGFCAFRELYDQKKDADVFEQIKETVKPLPMNTSDTSAEEIPSDEKTDLSAITPNGDCIGWITISGTALNYPVMYTPDAPEYYLRRNFYKEYSQSGVPFLDARCTMSSSNLIIYGHNMKNGTMFSALKGYIKKSFWDSHQMVTLQLYDNCYQFEVFAVLITDVSERFYSFICASGEDNYNDMIQYAKKKAVYDTGITPEYGDRLLTLSTCYGSAKSGRILILARQI